MKRSVWTVGVALLAGLLLGAGGAVALVTRTHLGHRAFERVARVCPRHPNVTSSVPDDCPICGTILVPAKDAAASGIAPTGAPDVHAGHAAGAAATGSGVATAAKIEGLAPFTLEPGKIQKINVRYGTVERRAAKKTLRTVAFVEPDERKIFHVHTKFEGWIERLHVAYVGARVARGEPLVTVYSPTVLTGMEEYRLSRRLGPPVGPTPASPTGTAAPGSLGALARRRLELWDIPEDEIARLDRGEAPSKEVKLRAPIAGHVIVKEAFQGLYFEPGTNLYTVADLSVVWVQARFYERDIPFVREGAPVGVEVPAVLGRRFDGRVAYLYPTVDPATRTIIARIEVQNSDLLLKPGMFANVTLEAALGDRVVVPDAAVLRAGERAYAFVALEEGRFEPRELTLGIRGDEWIEVTSGLEAGERVTTSANFLLDSESRLRAALEGMGMGGMHGGH